MHGCLLSGKTLTQEFDYFPYSHISGGKLLHEHFLQYYELDNVKPK